MKKLRIGLCIALILSLIIPNINFTSIAQENNLKNIEVVDINWIEDKNDDDNISEEIENTTDEESNGTSTEYDNEENNDEVEIGEEIENITDKESNDTSIEYDNEENNDEVEIGEEIENTIDEERNDTLTEHYNEENSDEVEIDEEIINGEFHISTVYENDAKVYIGGQDIPAQEIDIVLNDKEIKGIKFDKSDNRLNEDQSDYIIADITSDVAVDSENGISFNKNIFSDEDLEKIKIIVAKEVNINNDSDEVDITTDESSEDQNNKDRYEPTIYGNAVETKSYEDMYPLTLDWTKTQTSTSETNANYEDAIELNMESGFEKKGDKFILNDNTDLTNQKTLETLNVIRDSDKHYLDYKALLSYIEPKVSVNWQTDETTKISIDSWKHTTDIKGTIINSSEQKDYYAISWRMYRGIFKLTQEQIDAINAGTAQLLLGVEAKDENGNSKPTEILGVNDYLAVFANGKTTPINVTTKIGDNINLVTYNEKNEAVFETKSLLKEKNTVGPADKEYECNEPTHLVGKSITDPKDKNLDGWHLHLYDKYETSGNTTILGDVTNLFVNNNTNPKDIHRLEMLTGESADTGGITKLEVYYVGKPQISATKSAYIIENGEEIEVTNNLEKEFTNNLSVTSKESVTPGESVYFKFGIENTGQVNLSENIHFVDYNEDLGIELYIDNEGVYKTDSNLQKGSKIYDIKDITVKKYNKNNEEVEKDKTNAEKLSSLKIGERIEVYANKDEFKYTPENEDIGKTLINTVYVGCTYMDEELKAEASLGINIVENRGSLRFKKIVDGNSKDTDDQEFTINIKGDDGSEYNVRLKRNEEKVLDRLLYGVTYTITEKVVPMNYEFTGISFETNGSGVVNNGKTLEIKLSKDTDGKLVTVENTKTNDDGLFDNGYIKNILEYIKGGE